MSNSIPVAIKNDDSNAPAAPNAQHEPIEP